MEKGTKGTKAEKSLFWGGALAVLCLVVMGIYLQNNLDNIAEAGIQRAKLRKSALQIKILKSLIVDAETGQRGFLLTGNQRYLRPYNAVAEDIDDKFAELEILLSNSPAQLELLRRARELTGEKLNELKRTVDLKRRGFTPEALEIVKSDNGQEAMESLRNIFDEMEIFQEAQIVSLSGAFVQTIRKSKKVNFLGTTFLTLLTLGLIFLFQKNVRIRSHLHKSLVELVASLRKKEEIRSEVIAIQNDIAASYFDLHLMLDKVVHLSMHLTKSDGALIEELDLESGDLVYRYAAGAAVPYLGIRVQARNSFSGLCVRVGHPLLCKDSEVDDRVDKEACRRVHLRSMIVVPLYYGDRLLGVLKNYSEHPNYYSEEVFEALSLVSGMLSSSLGRAKEFEKTQEEIQALRRLSS
ncbi:hypothetical protein DOM22_08485 [Bdellovibrio sp. ZAP7]|uniref:CHASE3 domain-containing protein n=1 Tax=Bdellovibrio sp. ZAP7 TaxID=2231053 RepID=UPI00115C10A8|nr:CHASE3 domain-containing protein [Bdellovibrio sp. ZAP7]QDK45190.1 hypothetical protein DOM22_08485 [Bdellovibrio sp. ZAP7]